MGIEIDSDWNGNRLMGVNVSGELSDPLAEMALAVAAVQERAAREGMPAALILPDELWDRLGEEAILARPAPEGCYWAREADLIAELPPLNLDTIKVEIEDVMAATTSEAFRARDAADAERRRRGYVGPARNRAERRGRR